MPRRTRAWLDVIWESHCDHLIGNFIKETSARLCSKVRQPKIASMADFLNLSGSIFSTWVPNCRSIFQLRPDQDVVGYPPHLWHLGPYVTFYKIKCSVCIVSDDVYVGTPGQITGDIKPKIPGTAGSIQGLTVKFVGGIDMFPGPVT